MYKLCDVVRLDSVYCAGDVRYCDTRMKRFASPLYVLNRIRNVVPTFMEIGMIFISQTLTSYQAEMGLFLSARLLVCCNYLIVLQAALCFRDEFNVLSGESHQLTVAGSQVDILKGMQRSS